MPRFTTGKHHACPRPRTAKNRTASIPQFGSLADPSSLITIPRLESTHAACKITNGASSLKTLARTLVEIDLATEQDWLEAKRDAYRLVELVLSRFLADRGQATIAKHCELYLTLAESISGYMIDDPEPAGQAQLFLLLNVQSCYPIRVGPAIKKLEKSRQGLGRAFYDSLQCSLCKWLRIYDHVDAKWHIEQMQEWVQGEEDPDSYEIPNLDRDLPAWLKDDGVEEKISDEKISDEKISDLKSFSLPRKMAPWLRKLIETTIELNKVAQSVDCPAVDQEVLHEERDRHDLDSSVPSILLYFDPGDAVMACFDEECERWGQQTPEPNLIVPLCPDDPASVRDALAAIAALLRLLVLTIEIDGILEAQEENSCNSALPLAANSK